MAIELTGIVPRNERRLRLVFSSAPAAGAFGTPGPAAYIVDNEDGAGPSPGIASAIIVAGAVTNVDLALDADLAQGALYRVRAIGVLGVDATTSTSLSDQRFRFGVSAQRANFEPKANDAEILMFGRDLFWTGTDYGETAEGDLATVGGLRNAQGAQRRRMLGAPLAWAPEYSPRARQYVDAPLPSIGTLRGKLEANSLRDDRVKSVTATLILDEETPEESYFEVTPVFIGGRVAESFDVPVFVP